MSAGGVSYPVVGRVVRRRERGNSLIDWQGVIVEQLSDGGYVRVAWGRTSLPEPGVKVPSNVETLDELVDASKAVR